MQRIAFGYGRSADRGTTVRAALCYPNGTAPKRRPGNRLSDLGALVAAATVAGVVSGAPSTTHAVLTGADPLAAARAAGNLLLPDDAPAGALLGAGAVSHAAISLGWTAVIAAAVDRSGRCGRSPVVTGLVIGAAIAAIDLGVLAHGPLGRRWPLIRALPVWPQVADHLAFGAVAGAVLDRRVGKPS